MKMRRAVLPMAVFTGVIVFHFAWLYFFPEADPAQRRWETAPQASSALVRYIDGQDYFLGYSYALALSFAAVAFRSYREKSLRSAGGFAIGGLTFSGFLAFAGCFLLGCCGSPMLGVYISLFGAGFLPFAKPLVAIITTISIIASWWWMNRRAKRMVGLTTLENLSANFVKEK